MSRGAMRSGRSRMIVAARGAMIEIGLVMMTAVVILGALIAGLTIGAIVNGMIAGMTGATIEGGAKSHAGTAGGPAMMVTPMALPLTIVSATNLPQACAGIRLGTIGGAMIATATCRKAVPRTPPPRRPFKTG